MKSKGDDLLRNLSIGITASLPYVGGILAYTMDKKIPSQVDLRYSSFVESLENDINTMKKNLNYSRFETPQFYSVFIKVLHEVISNHLEEKIIAYKNILINTVDLSWNCNKNDFFISITTHLSIDSLNYLYLIYLGIAQSNYENISFSLSNLIKRFKAQSDYLMTIVSELSRYRLIRGVELTDLGKQYCDFVFSPVPLHRVNISLNNPSN